MSKKNNDSKMKVVLVGETQTGKTCIIMKAIHDIFEENKMTTYVAASYAFDVKIDSGKTISLDIWDTAGQERFRTVNRIFYKNARAVLLVYNVTERKSFEAIKEYWTHQAKTCACINVVLGVIGNKSDLFEFEQVKEDEAKEYAKSIGAFFMMTSAKCGTGINDMFKETAELIEKAGPIQERIDGDTKDNSAVKLEKEKNQKKSTKKKFCS